LKILLTGGLGFTGTYLRKEAAYRGYEVVLLRSDITDSAGLKQELSNLEIDAVIHLAALSHVTLSGALDYYRVNVVGTCQLLATIMQIRQPPDRVLIASSANVYGAQPRSPISESSPPAPINDYGASKLAMEFLAQAHAASHHFRLIVARPFNYTGRGQSAEFLIPKLVGHFRERKPIIRLGNLGVAREYNDVKMVCRYYLDLLEAPDANGLFNICSGQAHQLSEVLTLLTSMTGHRPKIEIDANLIRRHEIPTLFGDPSRLHQALLAGGKSPVDTSLPQILENMLLD
jgi:nucleoside-diphosphate-sugar epimerase